MITRGEFFMIKEMYERRMSISDIARELGIDQKTVRKYIHSLNPPSKSKRKQRKSKLDPFKPYLQKQMFEDGVFNSEKLFLDIRQQGYTGGKTILKDYMQPFRETAKKKYMVRYETLPGEIDYAQKDFNKKKNRRIHKILLGNFKPAILGKK